MYIPAFIPENDQMTMTHFWPNFFLGGYSNSKIWFIYFLIGNFALIKMSYKSKFLDVASKGYQQKTSKNCPFLGVFCAKKKGQIFIKIVGLFRK